jgi:hypothetical protein
MMQKVLLSLPFFVEKIATFTTILRVKKCHFHYDMQKIIFERAGVGHIALNALYSSMTIE